eukprot:TRINITY_DN3989_c0_g2_i1.p1 TRINITY_DN3989_c0_g2~~TRINITY_DN3989_c0_g2_i1.p1  ORF type:complete len:322 (+),score=34.65 TRINITY_DN3989_c0_g2_i1:316-1281(+)
MVQGVTRLSSEQLLRLLATNAQDICLLRIEVGVHDGPSIKGSVVATLGDVSGVRCVGDVEGGIPLVDRIVFKAREYCSMIVVYSSKRGDEEKRLIGKVCKILVREDVVPCVGYLSSFVEFKSHRHMLELSPPALLREGSSSSFNSECDSLPSTPPTPTPLSLHDRRQRAHSAVFTNMNTSSSCKCSPPTLIVENLYLGNAQNAANSAQLQQLGIQHVVNVSTEVPNFHEGKVAYSTYRVPDTEESAHLLQQHFEEIVGTIRYLLGANKSVLVHCFVGVSRSCAVVTGMICLPSQHCSLPDEGTRVVCPRCLVLYKSAASHR